jgi:hypothetical protein
MQASRILTSIPQPNIQKAQTVPGINASNTRCIMTGILFDTGRWGEL